MTLDSILGWCTLIALLVALGAGLVLPLLYFTGRTVGFGRMHPSLRLAVVAAGGIALWFAIPPLVEHVQGWR